MIPAFSTCLGRGVPAKVTSKLQIQCAQKKATFHVKNINIERKHAAFNKPLVRGRNLNTTEDAVNGKLVRKREFVF